MSPPRASGPRALRIDGGVVVVPRDGEAPPEELVRTVIALYRVTRSLLEALFRRLRAPERDGQAAGGSRRLETEVIRSRAMVAAATRLVARTTEADAGRLVGAAPPLVAVVRELPAIARSDLPVLIVGESGTGKDLVAQTIHRLGRGDAPFLAQQCGSLPDTLIEAELFGVKKGAFTGATQDRAGLLAHIGGGSLFLDGVDAVSEELQRALLRVLEEGEVRPLGGTETVRVRFRLIGASRLPLPALRARLREDFFFRLKGFTVTLPPLRTIPGDLPIIARELLRRWSLRTGNAEPAVSEQAWEALRQRAWPGNVRELGNVLERALLADPRRIEPAALDAVEDAALEAGQPARTDRTLKEIRDEAESRYLRALVLRNRGRVQDSARAAGITRRHLLTLLKRHGIDPADFRSGPKRQ